VLTCRKTPINQSINQSINQAISHHFMVLTRLGYGCATLNAGIPHLLLDRQTLDLHWLRIGLFQLSAPVIPVIQTLKIFLSGH